MMISDDTICAVSTAPGVGGIAVIRVSGARAIEHVMRLWRGADLAAVKSHTAHLGTVCNIDGSVLDQAVATVFRGPHSFTGDDVVELSVHGSKYVQRQLITSLIDAGCRLAEPGEFTRRAFAAGKMDLAQAEAVADIIASTNRASHRIAMNQMRGQYSRRISMLRDELIDLASLLELELDFSEEDVEFASRVRLLEIARQVREEVDRLAASFSVGKAIKDGIPVAIIGATNAGKSSLLNALLGDDRAIVSDIHGTTRDIVEDTLDVGDYTFRLMDTAGLRATKDEIENLGIERSRSAASRAQIVIIVVDSSNPVLPDIPATDAQLILVVNKIDLDESPDLQRVLSDERLRGARIVRLAAKLHVGVGDLTDIMETIASEALDGHASVLVTNARHYQALREASAAINRAIEAIESELSGDLIAIDVRLTISALNDILGEISSQEILNTIFSRFCIGK